MFDSNDDFEYIDVSDQKLSVIQAMEVVKDRYEKNFNFNSVSDNLIIVFEENANYLIRFSLGILYDVFIFGIDMFDLLNSSPTDKIIDKMALITTMKFFKVFELNHNSDEFKYVHKCMYLYLAQIFFEKDCDVIEMAKSVGDYF